MSSRWDRELKSADKGFMAEVSLPGSRALGQGFLCLRNEKHTSCSSLPQEDCACHGCHLSSGEIKLKIISGKKWPLPAALDLDLQTDNMLQARHMSWRKVCQGESGLQTRDHPVSRGERMIVVHVPAAKCYVQNPK